MHVPELILGGPDVPPELLNAFDDKCAVFFCGAGISVGSGLPSFKGLVSDTYAALHQSATAIEQDLICHGQLDKALGLLEGRLSDRRALRKVVIDRLSEPAKGDLALHKALLRLSRTNNGRVRLVTTNFDNRFIEAGASDSGLDVSPRLPVPKRYDWDTLVHLHGRIDQNGGRNLILTGADFGRAYLSEGWAARFVTELFREFTVVFVGYSLNDPVMSYLVDALAAEREQGAGGFRPPFAFAEASPGSQQDAAELWGSKGVEPVIYDPTENHRLLTDTMVEWARVTGDPLGSRTSIALEGIRKPPIGPHDKLTKRVIWALSYPGVAQALSEAPPVTDDSEFPIFIAWLDVLYDAGLLGSIETPNAAPIVDPGYRATNLPAWTSGTRYLAWWIARHLHIPQLIEWMLRRGGGALHPQMKDMVRDRLWRDNPDEVAVVSQLRLYWQILSSPPCHIPVAFDLPELLSKAVSDGERSVVESEALHALNPTLILKPGPTGEVRFRRMMNADAPEPTPLEECAHLHMTLAGEGSMSLIGPLIKQLRHDKAFLSKNASHITTLIERALDLRAITGGATRRSYGYRPSIADHAQNRHPEAWTELITLAREGYEALAEVGRERADNLIQTWLSDGRPIFRRMALHAVTTDEGCDVGIAEKILLADVGAGLWDIELSHEVAVFLRTAAIRLDQGACARLIAAISAGPPFDDDAETDAERKAWRDFKIWKYLEKLACSGCALTDEANVILLETARQLGLEPSEDDSDEFPIWSGEARWCAPGENVPEELKRSKPFKVAQSFEQAEIPEEQWRDYAEVSPKRAFLVLAILGRKGTWSALHVQHALWAVRTIEGLRDARLDKLIAGLLRRAPSRVFQQAGSAIAGWLEDTATTWPHELFSYLWFGTWEASTTEGSGVSTDDVLTMAINHVAGKLAEAVLRRLWQRDPARDSGLTSNEKRFFDAIVDGRSEGQDLGRVVLARILWNLHSIDRAWVKARLLPFFKWTSPEAKQMWQAYAWNARLSPNLFADARELLLETFARSSELGEQSDHIIQAFASLTVHVPDALRQDEIIGVIARLNEDGLVTILRWFARLLAGPNDQRAKVWDGIIRPWIAAYWPTGIDRNTPETTASLADLVIETGMAFPRALEVVLPYLLPINEIGRIVWQLDDDEDPLYQNAPIAVFELLNAITGNVEPWSRGALKNLLNKIAAVSVVVRKDARWHRLMRIAQS